MECHPVHRSGKEAARSIDVCASCHRFSKGSAGAVVASHPGEETCSTCHTFHAKAGEGGRAFRGKEIRPEGLCRGCHPSRWAADVKEGRAAGTHVTVASVNGREICSRCHRMHEAPAGTSLLRSPKPYSCLECHEAQNTIREEGGIALAHPVFEKVAKGRLTETVREKRLVVGSSGEIVCRTCHKVHAAVKETPLLSPGAEKAESCFWCHPGNRGKSHGGAAPGTVIQCLECHPVHGRKISGGDPWRTLCRRCHPGTSQHQERAGGRESERDGDLPRFNPRGRKSPFGAVTCPTCHTPHGGGEGAKRVRKPYRPIGLLCTTCHRTQDTVVLTPHDLRGIAGNSVCEPCHMPHGGESPWMWGPPRGTGERGEASCRACHLAGEGKGLGSRLPLGGHPTNIMASRPLPDRFPRIGPDGETSRTGVVSCPTCHDVHGSGIMPVGRGVGKLLRWPEAKSSGNLPNAEICSECHSGKWEKHGSTDCLSCHPPHSDEASETSCRKCHPVVGGALFDRHRKARGGCGSCHKLHGNGAKGEKSEEPCYGCHPATRKIRETPHALQGKDSCLACHPVHREPPVADVRPKLGKGIFRPDLPCLRCHQAGGTGPVPERLNHPVRTREAPTNYGATVTLETPVMMVGRFKEGERPMFPLFDPSGNRALSGVMGCLTCHDPHAGGTRDGKPGANAYLRDPGYVFLSDMCAPCHRGENVDRVRNFHNNPGKIR
jgi:predicted CXXCH cytochrome family protein